MTQFLQTLIDGLAVGSLYALIALGYTMVYGILKFINFAHSDVFVLGAWSSFTVALAAGWGTVAGVEPDPAQLGYIFAIIAGVGVFALLQRPATQALARSSVPAKFHLVGSLGACLAAGGVAAFIAFLAGRALAPNLAGVSSPAIRVPFTILLAMATCGAVGFAIERLAYKPLRKAPRLNVLITAIGVSLFMQNTGQQPQIFGPYPQSMPALLPDQTLAEIQGVKIHLVDLIGAGTAILLMIGLELLVFQTKIGRAMRAVSFNTRNAALMGINVDAIISFTFVLGSALAAAAGFLYVMKYPGGLKQPADTTWVMLGLKAFVAAVIGGIGNVRGAMLGGVLIGLVEFFGAAYLSTQFRDVYVFSLLILILLVRPSGLLGSTVAEKV